MGKEHDKQADVEDKKKKGADVDVDKEHNKDSSRKASNAALRGEAGAVAGSASNASASTALTFLAGEYYNWMSEIKGILASDTSGDAGSGPQIEQLERIQHRAIVDTMMARQAIHSMDAADRKHLRPQLIAVLSNWNGFKNYIHRAGSWIREQPGYEGLKIVGYERIEQEVKLLENDMHLEVPIATDEWHTTKPEGDQAHMTADMAKTELHALETAVASLEAGNTEDGKRVGLHAENLASFAKEHGVRISSKVSHGKLVAIKNKIDQLRGQHPEYKLDAASIAVSQLL